MLFRTPELRNEERKVLDDLDELRQQMRFYLHEPRRWYGALRRQAFARVVQGSNTIEGYSAELDDAAAVALGEEPMDADEETRLALQGYRDAMTYVLQLSSDSDFSYSEQLLKSLHFMMLGYDLHKRPGLWRQGAIYVQNDETGETTYEGPDIELVPALIGELVEQLNADDALPPMVRAGMAHLNLVMVHPFKDGNGRMARTLQSLVLAREGILAPIFVSIEEYLGRNTQAYYDVLAGVGQGSWQPGGDARPWLRFVLTAHLRQARTWFRRIKETERIWAELESVVDRNGLPIRAVVALYDATMGYRVRSATYRAALSESDEPISDQTASRDFRQLTELGLLVQHGQKRGTYYTAGDPLHRLRKHVTAGRELRDDSDPFAPNS
jgi:Fic family protein